MKFSFYFDIYPWNNETNPPMPNTTPGEKMEGAIRYRVDVEIPDPRKPDQIISGQPVVEA